MAKKQQKPQKNLGDKVLEGLSFSLVVCTWGLVVSVCVLGPWVFHRYGSTSCERVDYGRNESLKLNVEVCRRKKTMFDKYWCFYVETGWVFFVGWTDIMTPLFWAVYIQVSKSTFLMLFFVQVILEFLNVSRMHLGPGPEYSQWYLPLCVLTGCVPVAVLSILLKSRNLVKMGLMFFGLLVISLLFIMVFDQVQSSLGALSMALLVMPLVKGTSLALCRSMVRPLFFGEIAIAENVQIRKDIAWGLLLLTQCIFALLSRMIVTNLRDFQENVIFVVVNSLLEIAMRYSPLMHDRVIRKLSMHDHKSISLVAPETRNDQSDQVGNTGKENQYTPPIARNQWYALVLVGDMLSEYVAIFTNLGILVLYHDAILMMPLPVFELQERPFGNPMPTNTWLIQSIVHIACEILVDWFCLYIEQQKLRFPIQEVWQLKPASWRLNMCVVAGFTAVVYVITFFKYRREKGTVWCTSEFACSCMHHLDSLYGKYCLVLSNQTTGT